MSPTDSVFDEFAPPSIEPSEPLIPEESSEEPKRSKKRRESMTAIEFREGQSRLARLSDLAFDTLEDAMRNADYNTAVKASQITLDRSGHGPKTTVDVNTTHLELQDLSLEQLVERLDQVKRILLKQATKALPAIEAVATPVP